MNRLPEAEEAFKTTLKLNPNMWDVVAQYGDFLLNNGRAAEAVQYFKKVPAIVTHLEEDISEILI